MVHGAFLCHKMKNKKIKYLLIAGGIFAFFLLAFVEGVGVAAPYWEDNPLLVSPGEETIVTLYLQNTGEESITLEANITSEGGIATLEKTVYEVASGEIDVPVEIEVSVPSDIGEGSTYQVSVSFKQIEMGSGMVSVASAFTTSFPVKVVLEEKPSQISWTLIVPLIIIVVIILLLIVVKKVKDKKSSKKFK